MKVIDLICLGSMFPAQASGILAGGFCIFRAWAVALVGSVDVDGLRRVASPAAGSQARRAYRRLLTQI